MSRGERLHHRIVAAWRGGDDLGACRNAVIEERESREGAARRRRQRLIRLHSSTNAATELQFVNCNLHSARPQMMPSRKRTVARAEKSEMRTVGHWWHPVKICKGRVCCLRGSYGWISSAVCRNFRDRTRMVGPFRVCSLFLGHLACLVRAR